MGPATTFSECIDTLSKELGLPTTIMDLAGPGSRSRVSRRATLVGGDEKLRWTVTTYYNSGIKRQLSERVIDVLNGDGGDSVLVALDDAWMLAPIPDDPIAKEVVLKSPDNIGDLTRPDASSPGLPETEGDKDDTLKASKADAFAGPPLVDQLPRPAPARLSSIFAASVETNRHPAPPSTPQATLSGNDTDVADAIAQALSEDVDPGLPISHQDWRFGAPVTPLRENDQEYRRRSLETPRLSPVQHRSSKSIPTTSVSIEPMSSPPSAHPSTPTPQGFFSLSTGTGSSITKPLSQETGDSTTSSPAQDGWTKRFSLPGFGGWIGSPASTISRSMQHPSSDNVGYNGSIRSSVYDSVRSSVAPLEKQTTGGLWGWWTGSRPEEGSAEAYVAGLSHRSAALGPFSPLAQCIVN